MCAYLKTMSVCKKLKGIHTERLGKVRSVQATTIRGKLREMVWPSGWPWNMKGSGYIGQCGAVGEEGTLGKIFPGLNSAWLLKGGVTSGLLLNHSASQFSSEKTVLRYIIVAFQVIGWIGWKSVERRHFEHLEELSKGVDHKGAGLIGWKRVYWLASAKGDLNSG